MLYGLTWLTTTGLRFDDPVSDFLYSNVILLWEGQIPERFAVQFWPILQDGLAFSVPLMFILTCHELGHYIQSWRYGVYCSLPYFIPLPFGPIGTMGAVIGMGGEVPDRRALFDIGISGPLAGLVPTLICCVIGMSQAQVVPRIGGVFEFGDPLLMLWLSDLYFGPIPGEMTIYLNAVGMAGWFGLFLTTLNLFPIGQLDGGHVFYAILGRRAGTLSMLL